MSDRFIKGNIKQYNLVDGTLKAIGAKDTRHDIHTTGSWGETVIAQMFNNGLLKTELDKDQDSYVAAISMRDALRKSKLLALLEAGDKGYLVGNKATEYELLKVTLTDIENGNLFEHNDFLMLCEILHERVNVTKSN